MNHGIASCRRAAPIGDSGCISVFSFRFELRFEGLAKLLDLLMLLFNVVCAVGVLWKEAVAASLLLLELLLLALGQDDFNFLGVGEQILAFDPHVRTISVTR